jgi:hypothetical protein
MSDEVHADIDRKAEQLADEFEAKGFLVTRRLEVEPAGAALFLSVQPRTLKNWRSILGEDGPRYRQHRLRIWYSIRGLLEWDPGRRPGASDASDLDGDHASSAE